MKQQHEMKKRTLLSEWQAMAALSGVAMLGAAALGGCGGGGSGPNPPVAQGRIVFASNRNETPQGPPYTDIFSMKPDGSDAQRLTSGEGSEGEPAYSRDRSKIAFVGIALNDILNFSRRSQIYLMNADGSNQRQLTNLPAGQTARVPTFSDDGTKIAFGGGSDGNGGIFVINVDGSNLRQLTTQGSNPSWSKNNKIAFDALQPTAIQQSNTQAQATTESKRLQARDVFVPGGSYIFIINPDGSGLTRITNTGSEHTPSFSPDGNKIVYGRSGIGVDAALFSVNADGSNSTLLRNGGLSPVFSPDGQQIAFEDSPGVLSEIFTIKVDGTGLTRLTNNTSLDQDPYWR